MDDLIGRLAITRNKDTQLYFGNKLEGENSVVIEMT